MDRLVLSLVATLDDRTLEMFASLQTIQRDEIIASLRTALLPYVAPEIHRLETEDEVGFSVVIQEEVLVDRLRHSELIAAVRRMARLASLGSVFITREILLRLLPRVPP